MRLRSGETFDGIASVTGKPHGRAQHRVGDSGVAAGGVQQVLVLRTAEQPALHRIQHDRLGGAILDGAAGIRPLRLAENLNAGKMLCQPLQTDQRGVADAIQNPAAKHADCAVRSSFAGGISRGFL